MSQKPQRVVDAEIDRILKGRARCEDCSLFRYGILGTYCQITNCQQDGKTEVVFAPCNGGFKRRSELK